MCVVRAWGVTQCVRAVQVHMYGVGVPTNATYLWGDAPNHTFPDARPAIIGGDGDGE